MEACCASLIHLAARCELGSSVRDFWHTARGGSEARLSAAWRLRPSERCGLVVGLRAPPGCGSSTLGQSLRMCAVSPPPPPPPVSVRSLGDSAQTRRHVLDRASPLPEVGQRLTPAPFCWDPGGIAARWKLSGTGSRKAVEPFPLLPSVRLPLWAWAANKIGVVTGDDGIVVGREIFHR